MKAQLHRISYVLGCIVMFAGVTQAQVSGVPGDGIPDVYYWAVDNAPVTTSAGVITRPLGTVLVDTDSVDMVALLIGSPSDSLTTELAGATASLPDPNNPPFNNSSWTTGFDCAEKAVHPHQSAEHVGVCGSHWRICRPVRYFS